MPKAGSTALQHSLFSARDALLEKGFLYPDPGVGNYVNHGLMASKMVGYEKGPREYRKFSEKQLEKWIETFEANLARQMREIPHDTLILSSEYFARMHRPDRIGKLAAAVESIGATEVELLVYVRRPSSFFLSAAQQKIRASTIARPLGPRNVVKTLDQFCREFGDGNVTVRTFERGALQDGDIVADFAASYMPELKDVLVDAGKRVKKNESMSAEAMVLLQAFRRDYHFDQNNIFKKDSSDLFRTLQKLDQKLELSRPVLKAGLRDHIDYQDDLCLILREKYGVTFAEIDYGRLETGRFVAFTGRLEDVRDIVDVNEARLGELISELSNCRWAKKYDQYGWLQQQTGENLPRRASTNLGRWIQSWRRPGKHR